MKIQNRLVDCTGKSYNKLTCTIFLFSKNDFAYLIIMIKRHISKSKGLKGRRMIC